MSILGTILLVVAAIIAFVLIVALFKKKEYTIEREIIVNAPAQKVYDYLKLLKNQDNFNKWVMVDPNMKRDFKGTDGTIGFVYAWDGNKKAGSGEQEIKNLVEGKSIDTEIRFFRPFSGIAFAINTLEPISENQTKVIWNNTSSMKYPMNILVNTIEKMLAKDMDISLNNLKEILEK